MDKLEYYAILNQNRTLIEERKKMKSTIHKQAALSLWWSKIGERQALATFLMLLAYIITSSVVRNKEPNAATILFAFLFAIVAVIFSLAKTPDLSGKAFWLSCAGHFIVTFALMLITILLY